MHEIFDEVVREISVRRVEMKMKAKFRVNLFQNENASLFSINSFVNASDYWQHLSQISFRVRNKVEADYRGFKDLLDSLDFLHFLYSDIRGIRAAYLPDNQELVLDSLQVDGLFKYRQEISLKDVLVKKVMHFFELQKMMVTSIEQYLSQKIRSIQERFRLLRESLSFRAAGNSNTVMPNAESNAYPEQNELVWNRSDTDMLELITALYESKSVKSNSGKLNKKVLQQAFEKLFHHTIKGAGAKLTKARDRKNQQAVFMEELKNAFSNYVTRKDFQLDSRR